MQTGSMVVPSSAIHGSPSPAGRVQRRPHLRPSLGENPYTGKSGLGRKPADPDAEHPRLKRDEAALPPTHAQSEWARIAGLALPHSAKPVRSMFISVRYGPLRSIPRRPFPSFPRFLSSYESAFSVRRRSRSRAWTHSPPAATAQKPPSRPASSGSPPARPAAR